MKRKRSYRKFISRSLLAVHYCCVVVFASMDVMLVLGTSLRLLEGSAIDDGFIYFCWTSSSTSISSSAY